MVGKKSKKNLTIQCCTKTAFATPPPPPKLATADGERRRCPGTTVCHCGNCRLPGSLSDWCLTSKTWQQQHWEAATWVHHLQEQLECVLYCRYNGLLYNCKEKATFILMRLATRTTSALDNFDYSPGLSLVKPPLGHSGSVWPGSPLKTSAQQGEKWWWPGPFS